MKCKGRFVNLFAVLVIAVALLSFTSTGLQDSIDPQKAQFFSDCHRLNDGHGVSSQLWAGSGNQAANPMDRVFQIIFILFFISPPLIVILLFLIWCELRRRNDNK